jgi:hypothetical protein
MSMGMYQIAKREEHE